jgi:hypothetical protein
VPYGLALGVARLVLLLITAAGFMAMHALAATDPAGVRHSPIVVPATSMADPDHAMAAHVHTSGPVATASDHDCGHSGHEMATACLFVLLSAPATVAWYALHAALSNTTAAVLRALWRRHGPARAPPRPIFLSLCVFRL